MIRKAALLTMLTATLLSPAAVALPGMANAQATAVSRQTPQLLVEAIGPDVPREPTTEIKISGSFVNAGTEALSGVRVRMHYAPQPFTRRADLQAYQSGQGPQPSAWRNEQYLQQGGTVAPSAKAPWEFAFTPQQLGISRFGVYPIMIEALDSLGQQIAVQRTFVSYMPKNAKVTRTRLALVLPIIDQPRRADDSTFIDDTLPASMATGKRLGDLLKIAQDTASAKNITWVFDPAVLDDAQAMGKPHTVKSTQAPANPAAAKWLNDLRTALAKPPVVATPYGDPDVTALAHNGVDDVTREGTEAAKLVARQALGRDVITNVNWPANGSIDYDGLDLLSSGGVGGVDTVLLNAPNLPNPSSPSNPSQAVPPVVTTPDAATTVASVNGPVTALVADAALSEIIDAETSTPGAALLNRQRFIAETAMISSEPVTTPRTVVAAPDRRWDPDPAYVTKLVKTAAALPWLAPATLDTMKPAKTARTPRADLAYTDQDRRKELDKSYMSKVKRVSARIDLTTAVTKNKDLHLFDLALLRLTSSAWRGRTSAAAPYVKQIGTTVDGRIGKVYITGGDQPQFRTLAGADGEVPISVRNELRSPNSEVAVRLKVTSDKPDLLKIEPYENQEDPIIIRSGQNQTIRVPMTATPTASGQTTVTVQLTTSDGRKYGKPVELTVRTTGYTGIALVIVGAALMVMLAAVIMRVLRRRGARRATAAIPPRPAGAPAGNES
ncbi:DUF6049 family protein [Streptosporangium sp. NPDC000396]|uniref:DUF6049 family protein n=1 Tax=Streptosporangium sp. NPDC000396 TaxID=3366185 RepID=UPI003697AC88